MDLPRVDPLPAFRFLVALVDTSSPVAALGSLASLALGGFTECTGLESTVETAEYREGGLNDRLHRFASQTAPTNIVLRRGVGLGEDLWLWHEGFVRGEGVRKDGLVILQDQLGVPIKMWSFSKGIPIKWTGPALHAQQSEVAIETLEIAHEKLELVVSPGALLGRALSGAAPVDLPG